ncbi:hypothetical protein [Paracandidimonas soli]|uniref:Uncharacterized protein n=1 Tax=Paracandidimonas soli TaxID=1917182 RepID=A0A4R3V234_9BURK|nr:hypothetical protein [Paracandidimonas soli]TCU97293.1 hypothetical protein EV686_106176 [Paracandidimonas soli]
MSKKADIVDRLLATPTSDIMREAAAEIKALRAEQQPDWRAGIDAGQEIERNNIAAQVSWQDSTNAEVAAEYERWIRAHAEGRDYDDFLAGELAARAAGSEQ